MSAAMANGITIGAEALSACVMLVVLFTMLFENKEKSLRTTLFCVAVGVGIFACIFDAISYYLDGHEESLAMLYISNTLSILLAEVLSTVFVFYIVAFIRETTELSWRIPKLILGFVVVSFFIAIIGISNGKLFYIENGFFKEGVKYTYVGCPSILSMLVVLGIDIKYRKALGLHDFLSILVYIIMPILAKVLEQIFSPIAFVYPATSICVLLFYILLQNKQLSALEIREKVLTELSNRDTLTGIGNRRAFSQEVLTLKGDKTIAALFCDINGLKFVNDTYGHAAGDELILRFTKLIQEHFGTKDDHVYRISGDEFVIVATNVDRSSVQERIRHFIDATVIMDHIAAVGAAVGTAEESGKLVKEAEINMYDDKSRYYQMEGSHKR